LEKSRNAFHTRRRVRIACRPSTETSQIGRKIDEKRGSAKKTLPGSPFSAHFSQKWVPRSSQGSPKGAQGAQKEPQSHPRDTSKSLKNRRVTSNEKTSRKEGSGGAPGRENDTKIDQKTTNFSGDRILKKASISSCFLKPFGETIGGTVPKKAFIPSCFHLPIPTASHAGTLRDTQGHRFPRDTLSTIDRTHCPAQR